MKVESAWYENGCLVLQIDGHRVTLGEKYTILELGFAVLLGMDEFSREWLGEVSETIPAGGDGGRKEPRGGSGHDWPPSSRVDADTGSGALAVQ